MIGEITYYLEMTSPDALQIKPQPDNFEVKEVLTKEHEFNRKLYQLVGHQWQWSDRLFWSDDAWQEYVESDKLRTWAAYFKGQIAGYYELQKQKQGNVEIIYFGLTTDLIGKGLGGYMLSHATQSAWQRRDTKRVWLHTCNFDHENALNNYLARGFSLYKTEKNESAD